MAASYDPSRLTFGIYPGSAVGDDSGQIVSGPPDDPTRIARALEDLQGRDGRPLLVRAYRVFADADDPDRRSPVESPAAPARHAGRGRRLDLVAQYQSRRGDISGYDIRRCGQAVCRLLGFTSSAPTRPTWGRRSRWRAARWCSIPPFHRQRRRPRRPRPQQPCTCSPCPGALRPRPDLAVGGTG